MAMAGVADRVIARTVTVAAADFVESAAEVAVIVTFKSLGGGVAGPV